ncbi:hypothetical protein EYW49_10185 [Siculibacillus lacustris]|uniref:Cobalamin biosynthesis protein CbiX n=1 Tax=Siculibacillus lacustris TaxID=1549641 RepID=A0A4Q9VRE8_9HYPH|nr:hypothetical protein [Siculibacillus lacustris]TBW37974.1 hypothetical protein EYW49_10185 [Siculibacillus lacustris]
MTAPPAPAATGLLIVAHGDGGADPQDATLRRLATRLAVRLPLPVAWATLKRPESFAAARERLGSAAARPVIYPLFMTEGRFVRVRLPRVLEEQGLAAATRLPVFGHDPGLIDLLAARIAAVAAASGRDDLRVVLIAHGSASGDAGSRTSSEHIAAALAARLGRAPQLGFIEEAPRFDTVIGAGPPEIVVGLFVSAGTHAIDDVAATVAVRPSVIHHVAAIGEDDGVADLVAAAVTRGGIANGS